MKALWVGSLLLIAAVGQAVDKQKPKLELISTNDPAMASIEKDFEKTFYDIYPKLLKKRDNPKNPATRVVTVEFKKDMNYPAGTSGGKITCSIDWFSKHPDDLGAFTHELTHVVQNYQSDAPGWLVEGIADYSRYLFGPNTTWKLPDKLTEKNKYTQAYRVTARFLVWIEKDHKGFVQKVNRDIQQGKFTMDDFKKYAGKDVDTLWNECVASFASQSKAAVADATAECTSN
jgi:hypothetical protein